MQTTDFKRLDTWSALEGKAIRCVLERPCGVDGRELDAILILDDGQWCGLKAEVDGLDDAYISFGSLMAGYLDISAYLDASKLLDIGWIDSTQAALIAEQQKIRKLAIRQEKIELLRQRLAALEAESGMRGS
ncbi:hypothetical protein [Candidatus Glomeribacter gigasporarum]|uniref:hypothetical protein n=1 Tax=Candidatus Glomeribacter gigasporarum TaxID=132144 RepID=UPI0005B2B7D8|nr:hypothetical protein [Candidatus Glomeribacter gigasporarum]